MKADRDTAPTLRPASPRSAGFFVGVLTCVYRRLVRRAALQTLEGRLRDPALPERGRWLRDDVDRYLDVVWKRVATLLPSAALADLPTYGARHNVFLAVVTTAAYQELVERGVEGGCAAALIGDLGWKIYAWSLKAASLPFRIAIRDPHRRMERTLEALLRFPFAAPGAPGYEVRAWSEGDRFFTHWTHCPPQAFVRRLVESRGDRGELDAFYRSWCLYDWAAADLLAADGKEGHYSRHQTMSRGDSVCDMCWWGGRPSHQDRSRPPGPPTPRTPPFSTDLGSESS
jgi:hypothetical protein